MKRFILKFHLELLSTLVVGVAIFLIMNWTALPVLQRLVGLLFIVAILHEWEEKRFPGGFEDMIWARMGVKEPEDCNLDRICVAFTVLLLYFIPLFFPSAIWLCLAPMFLGLLEGFSHTVGVKIFHRPHFYTPGMITAWLEVPIAAYAFVYVIKNGPATFADWLFGLLYMIACLALMEILILRSLSIKISEIPKIMKNMRKAQA